MTGDDVVTLLAGLDGVTVQTAAQGDGSPEIAWGDSFFFYDPDDHPDDRRFPFATIVTKDYPGFDTASDLDRPGVFRLNVAVGRARFQELIGYPATEHAEHADSHDYAALDQLLPHPTYAAQAWVSIVTPGAATDELARSLLVEAHRRAVRRHRPAAS
jgi:hypothetical protein